MQASIAFLNGAASVRFRHRPRAKQRAQAILRTLLCMGTVQRPPA